MVTSSQDKKLRGRGLECITLIGMAVGSESLKPYLDKIIETILHVQTSLTDIDA